MGFLHDFGPLTLGSDPSGVLAGIYLSGHQTAYRGVPDLGRIKKAISAGVFGLGVLGGLWGCLAYPGAMFVVGETTAHRKCGR
jgi:hypothetical protein